MDLEGDSGQAHDVLREDVTGRELWGQDPASEGKLFVEQLTGDTGHDRASL